MSSKSLICQDLLLTVVNPENPGMQQMHRKKQLLLMGEAVETEIASMAELTSLLVD